MATTTHSTTNPPRGMFKDRRSGQERRFRDSILRDQGRRKTSDRRKSSDQFSPKPWWLKVNYVQSEIGHSKES